MVEFEFRTELGKMTPKIADGAKVYVYGCGKNYENIHKQFKYLVDVDIDSSIDGFIDGNSSKYGTTFHGKQIHALRDIDTANAVVLISTASSKDIVDISTILAKKGMVQHHSFFNYDWCGYLLMRYEYERLLQFKDCHKGERCFIIGNGPSLLTSDLDLLKNEYTFSSNKIHVIFDKTDWRPSYHVMHDADSMRETYNEIRTKIQCPVFYAREAVYEIENFNLKNGYFYSSDTRAYYKPPLFAKPEFSEEPFMLQHGGTVTYNCLQLAAYMGFSEIYLLGMDNNYSVMVGENGKLITNDINNHFTSYTVSINTLLIDYVNGAFAVARQYAETHGIKIFNATRGGKLEAFERIDFDSLF